MATPPTMNHPSSPMPAVSTQDGSSPHSPPGQRSRTEDRYRAPPPGYGPPLGYPQYPPYGTPQQNPYGGPLPPHGYPPTRGPPPGTYPAPPQHHVPSYGYGYPTGPRGPPYHYGNSYESAYPGAQPRTGSHYRNGVPSRPAPPPQSVPQLQHVSPQKVGSSPTSSPKSSPNRSSRDHRPPKTVDRVEVERLRAAAAAEISHEEVKPIQSDFHFFVKENATHYRSLAEEELRKSLKEGENLDHFLLNSNLNTRLMRAWESLTKEERDAYMIKEEEDRRRFMEEDEVASRHCATLTARGKSPRVPEKIERVVKDEERQENESLSAMNLDLESTSSGKGKDEAEEEKDSGESAEMRSGSVKGKQSAEEGNKNYESPTKRNRLVKEADK